MRIDRLRLTSYRGIGHAEVRFAAGVTIVEGDNEVGKTSLTEAVDLVLSVRDDSKKEAVRNLQPVGQDVGPEVEIEISTGPYRFVLRKRWLRRPETVLEVLAPIQEVHTGREAHERAQELLRDTLDLELWGALRLQQGADAGGAAFNVPALGRALDRAAGGERSSDREDHLWDRIVAERSRYWTATGRPSAERDRLTDRLAAAGDEVREVEAELRQLEAHVDEMARFERDAGDLAARQRDLDAQVVQLQERAAEVEVLRREVAHHAGELRTITAQRDRWQSTIRTRVAQVEALADRAQRVDAAETALAQAEPLGATATRRHESAVAARTEAVAALDAADAAHQLAQADLEHRRHQIEVAQLRERHQRVNEQRAALEQAESVLESVRIDAAAVAAIEAAHLDVVRAEAAAAAGAATVALRALDDATIEVDGQVVDLLAGAGVEHPVADATTVTVPGVLEVRVHAGAEAQALAERLSEARGHLADLCRRAAVADLAEARATEARRAEAEHVRRDAEGRIRDDLRDLSVDDLARKVARLTEKVAAYEACRPASPAPPGDFDDAQARAAETERSLAEARAAVAAADGAVGAALVDAREVEVTNAGLVAQVRLEREALGEAESALAVARATEPDDALAEALAEAEAAHDAASDQLAIAEAALRRHDPDTLADLLANATAAQARGRTARAENLGARHRLESVLETKGEQGLAERHDRALTGRDRLQVERDRLEARAAAAKLLHDTFDARRAEAHARYVAPFKEAIERLGRVVFGPSLEVELDADLRIATRTLDGLRLPFDQLSTGAREQLGIIARLACATIVAGDDGAPVILDDTLGWTDPQRLAQMAAAIGVAGRTCQIVLLTCTPGRFANVGDATTVRLPATAEDAARRSA